MHAGVLHPQAVLGGTFNVSLSILGDIQCVDVALVGRPAESGSGGDPITTVLDRCVPVASK